MLALTLTACAQSTSDQSGASVAAPSQSVIAGDSSSRPNSEGSGLPASRPCRFISAEELSHLTGLAVPAADVLSSDACIFHFSSGQGPAEDISLFLTTGGSPQCLSCTPVAGLGYGAGWSESSKRLNVLVSGKFLSVYVQLDATHINGGTREELAIRIYKVTEPRIL
jgi:hypothetical protein